MAVIRSFAAGCRADQRRGTDQQHRYAEQWHTPVGTLHR